MAHLCETKGCGYPARSSERLCPTCKHAATATPQRARCAADYCTNQAADQDEYCVAHFGNDFIAPEPAPTRSSLAQLYPKYYKAVGEMTEVDVYAIHFLFDIKDPSGAIHHSSKKLLLSGERTGGKTKYEDIKEARDTLNRWLELNPESKP